MPKAAIERQPVSFHTTNMPMTSISTVEPCLALSSSTRAQERHCRHLLSSSNTLPNALAVGSAARDHLVLARKFPGIPSRVNKARLEHNRPGMQSNQGAADRWALGGSIPAGSPATGPSQQLRERAQDHVHSGTLAARLLMQ